MDTEIDFSLFQNRIPIQVRTTDFDMYRHVNNTRYLDYYDLGKAEYFMAALDSRGAWNLRKMLTVIANVNCAFFKSIHIGDTVMVMTRCEKIGNKSFTLHQVICSKDMGEVYSECRTVMVCVNPETQKAETVPESWRDGFSEYDRLK